MNEKPLSLWDILQSEEEIKDCVVSYQGKLSKVKNIAPDYFPNKPFRIGIIGKGSQGQRVYHPNGLAITLSARGGGRGGKSGLYLINGKMRRLSVRECARLQGFDDGFQSPVSAAQAKQQIGNSVSIPVVRAVAEKLLKVLNNGENYLSEM